MSVQRTGCFRPWEPTASRLQRTGCFSVWEQRLRVHARGCFRPWGATAPVQRTGCFSPWERMPRVLARRCFTKWEQTLRVHAGGASARGGDGLGAAHRVFRRVGSDGVAQAYGCFSPWGVKGRRSCEGVAARGKQPPQCSERGASACGNGCRASLPGAVSARGEKRRKRGCRRVAGMFQPIGATDGTCVLATQRPRAHTTDRHGRPAETPMPAKDGFKTPSPRFAPSMERLPRIPGAPYGAPKALQKKPCDFNAQTTIACASGHLCLAKVIFCLALATPKG